MTRANGNSAPVGHIGNAGDRNKACSVAESSGTGGRDAAPRFLAAFRWQVVLQVVWGLRSAGLTVVYCWSLSLEEFGRLSAVMAYLALFRPVADLGLAATAPRLIAETGSDRNATVAAVGVRLLAGACVYPAALLLMPLVFGGQDGGLTLFQSGLLAAGAALDASPVLLAIGQQLGRFREMAIGPAIVTVIALALAGATAWAGFGLTGICVSAALIGPATSLACGWLLRPSPGTRAAAPPQRLIRAAPPQVAIDILGGLPMPLSIVLLGAWADMTAVGRYRIATQLCSLATVFLQGLTGVFRGRINRATGAADRPRLFEMASICGAVALSVAAGIVLVGPTFAVVLFGAARAGSGILVAALAPQVVIAGAMYTVLLMSLVVGGRRTLVAAQAISLVVVPAAAAVLVPRLRGVGAAAAVTAAGLAGLAIVLTDPSLRSLAIAACGCHPDGWRLVLARVRLRLAAAFSRRG